MLIFYAYPSYLALTMPSYLLSFTPLTSMTWTSWHELHDIRPKSSECRKKSYLVLVRRLVLRVNIVFKEGFGRISPSEVNGINSTTGGIVIVRFRERFDGGGVNVETITGSFLFTVDERRPERKTQKKISIRNFLKASSSRFNSWTYAWTTFGQIT